MTTTLDGAAIEAVAKLAEDAAAAQILEIGGYQFTNTEIARVDVDRQRPEPLDFFTLDGFIGYVQREPEAKQAVIQVVTPTLVKAVSILEGEDKHQRRCYAQASCKPSTAGFRFNDFGSLEGLAIALQTCFAPAQGDLDALRAFCASVRSSQSVGVDDDGVSQTVQAKKGIAAITTAAVKNPWALAPWRTFAEIPQPVSWYVLRFAEREQPTAGLFETGDASWIPVAVRSLAGYLRNGLGPDWTVLG